MYFVNANVKSIKYCILAIVRSMIMLSEKEFVDKVGSSLLRLRDKKRYSLENLAVFSGVDYSTINQIENGKRTPKSYTLYKLFYTLGVDITDIFSNETEEQEQLTRILTNKIKSLKAPQIKALLEFLDAYELKLKTSTSRSRTNKA